MTQYILVCFQIVFMVLIIGSGPWRPDNVLIGAVEATAIIFGYSAVIHMGIHSKFKGAPEPAKEAKLLVTGPYRYIRNPMYSSFILFFGALTIDHYTPLRLLFYILEIAVLLLKISMEEKFLIKKFPAYAAYKSRTKRLISFIY
ncbi:MAG TPA: methyltransferase family protein [Candidatus Wunengus sp. YC60]|uniref:methyltransferase family protein n=1 Tax=Candidatus Wunengus sp. YC60 TaxID=3367697 RepID=UPI0040255239